MSNRFKETLQIQEGASNRRLVSRKLHEMIVEVSDAGGDPDSDPAVFLVLHQLVWILTSRDMAHSHEEWRMATEACQAKVAEVQP